MSARVQLELYGTLVYIIMYHACENMYIMSSATHQRAVMLVPRDY